MSAQFWGVYRLFETDSWPVDTNDLNSAPAVVPKALSPASCCVLPAPCLPSHYRSCCLLSSSSTDCMQDGSHAHTPCCPGTPLPTPISSSGCAFVSSASTPHLQFSLSEPLMPTFTSLADLNNCTEMLLRAFPVPCHWWQRIQGLYWQINLRISAAGAVAGGCSPARCVGSCIVWLQARLITVGGQMFDSSLFLCLYFSQANRTGERKKKRNWRDPSGAFSRKNSCKIQCTFCAEVCGWRQGLREWTVPFCWGSWNGFLHLQRCFDFIIFSTGPLEEQMHTWVTEDTSPGPCWLLPEGGMLLMLHLQGANVLSGLRAGHCCGTDSSPAKSLSLLTGVFFRDCL